MKRVADSRPKIPGDRPIQPTPQSATPSRTANAGDAPGGLAAQPRVYAVQLGAAAGQIQIPTPPAPRETPGTVRVVPLGANQERPPANNPILLRALLRYQNSPQRVDDETFDFMSDVLTRRLAPIEGIADISFAHALHDLWVQLSQVEKDALTSLKIGWHEQNSSAFDSSFCSPLFSWRWASCPW
ncbi:MAG: hypothetical protein JWR25_816 [Noviherbaspirillum sp.]|nr:hypothetical protein [Noviherbaspirillum sp.]